MPDGSLSTGFEVAQAGPGAPGAPGLGGPVGRVENVIGRVTLIRADGTQTNAETGAPIFQGDTVETAVDGKLGIVFADNSTFSIGEKGKLTIDEMIYDPGAQTGKSALRIVEGVFSFVSGQIAKSAPDAMVLTTPVATIGIRGTHGVGKAAPAGQTNTIALMPEPGGSGELTVTTQTGSTTLNQPYQTTLVTNPFIPPTVPVVLSPAVIARVFGAIQQVLPPAPAGPSPAGAGGPTAGTAGVAGTGPTGQAAGPGGPTVPGGPGQPSGPALGPQGINAQIAAQAEAASLRAFENALALGGNVDKAFAAATQTAIGTTVLGIQLAASQVGGFGTPAGIAGLANAIETVMQNAIASSLGSGAFSPVGTPGGPGQGPATGPANVPGFGQIGAGPFGPGSTSFFGQGPAGPGNGGDGPFGPGVGPGPFGPNGVFGFNAGGLEVFGANNVLYVGVETFDVLQTNKFSLVSTDNTTIIADPSGSQLATSFPETKVGTTGADTIVGTSLNTNIYMGLSGSGFLGGSDTVDGGGGTNQLTFDNLDSLKFQLTMDSSVANKGTMTVTTLGGGTYQGGTSISFTNIQQFLFADGTTTFSSAYQSGKSAPDVKGALNSSDLSASAPISTGTETVVFPSLDLGEEGYAFIGGGGNDSITVEGTGADGALVFAKGGADIIDVRILGTMLLIGGPTVDNADNSGSDGIPDSNVNEFKFNSATFAALTVGGTAISTGGIQAVLKGTAGTAGGDGLVRNTNGTDDALLANIWEVGSFYGSQGPDGIIVNGGGYAVIDGDAGNDTFALLGQGKVGTLAGGTGTNSYNVSGSATILTLTGGSGTDTLTFGKDANGNTVATGGTIGGITGIETIAGGTGTDSVTLGSGGQTINVVQGSIETFTGGSGTDVLNFANSGVTLGNVSAIETIVGGTGTDVVTLANTTNSITVSNLETITGGTGADTIVDGSTATTINGGAGADTITGGAGADTINVGTDSVSDIIRYTSFSDGGSAGATTGYDTITSQFVTTNDVLSFQGLGLVANTAASVAQNGADFNGSSGGVFYINNATAASLTNLSNVVSAIGSISNASSGEKAVFLVRDGTGDTGVYAFQENGTNTSTISDSELSILAVADASLSETNVNIA